MQLIFLIIQIILAVAVIGTVLLQKTGSDSLGSLGGSGGVSGNNIVSGRASANFLTKATTVLMIAFMLNSLVLGNLAVRQNNQKSIVEKVHIEKEQQKTKDAPISE